MKLESNKAEFVGTIGEDVQESHNYASIVFYKVILHIRRTSGTIDKVPLIVRDRILQKCNVCKGSKVRVKGMVQKHGEWDKNRKMNHANLYIQVTEMEVVSEDELDKNEVFLYGTVYGSSVLRKTPLDRTIVDFSIISCIASRKTFRIFCIAWGSTANTINMKMEGDTVSFYGRFQSREYTKRWDDGEVEQRIFYEISVIKLIE